MESCDEKYYNHEPQPVYESTNNKMLLDFKVQTENKILHNKPDIVGSHKVERKCLIIEDIACLFNILMKDKDKRTTKARSGRWNGSGNCAESLVPIQS